MLAPFVLYARGTRVSVLLLVLGTVPVLVLGFHLRPPLNFIERFRAKERTAASSSAAT